MQTDSHPTTTFGQDLFRRLALANIISIIILIVSGMFLVFSLNAIHVRSVDQYLQMLNEKKEPSDILFVAKGQLQVLSNSFHSVRTLVFVALAAFGFEIMLALFIRSAVKKLLRSK